MVHYELLGTCPVTGARRGRLHTPHAVVETPAFMPVGTQGTVKTVGSEDLEALGFQLVLANTYHLALRPGSELIAGLGGLHRFMSWSGALLTDSGGYQVMSLKDMRTLSEDGVRFKSPLDGSELMLTPERAIWIQAELGVDVSMALDVCPPYPSTRDETAAAMAQTHRWAPRNLAAAAPEQAVFGIVQGGVHEELRRESAAFLGSLGFAGYAVGGVSVGEPTEMQRPVVEFTAPLLPADKVRYLMGVGHPGDILHAVASGIDLFDCVLPTRMARHQCLYTLEGRKNIGNAQYAADSSSIDPDFPTSARYSHAYLRHLFKANEPLGPRLATLHNLAFYARLMAEIRQAIEAGSWTQLRARYANA
ncbi:MAG: tRNA guanosine(34) transglycosylase Tgt [Fimbriimonadaceae bacterium]